MTTNSERRRHVARLFHEAVALPASERPAFLKQACRTDESLRSEVETLLEHALPETAGVAPTLPTDVEALHTGRRLGAYQLQDRIGAGGMGEVYRARDTRLGRAVAIKVLPRAFTGDPDRLALFAREARVLAR